jgi:hypothetical protein
MGSRWAPKIDESKFVISEESAEAAVRELLDFYEVDPTRSNQKDEDALDETIDDLAKAYRRGAFENKRDDNLGFCVIHHLKSGNKLTYRELGGKDRIVLEGFDGTKTITKTYALLGKLCGYGEDVIAKLKGQEWKDARNLAVVFMMASNG